MLLPASRKWHGFWDRTWQVNSLKWHDCWHSEVKPSFAKISTMPSVSLLGGNPVWETSALCWGICNCRCKAVRQTWSTLSTQDIYPLPFLILLALRTTEALPLRQQWQTRAFNLWPKPRISLKVLVVIASDGKILLYIWILGQSRLVLSSWSAYNIHKVSYVRFKLTWKYSFNTGSLQILVSMGWVIMLKRQTGSSVTVFAIVPNSLLLGMMLQCHLEIQNPSGTTVIFLPGLYSLLVLSDYCTGPV